LVDEAMHTEAEIQRLGLNKLDESMNLARSLRARGGVLLSEMTTEIKAAEKHQRWVQLAKVKRRFDEVSAAAERLRQIITQIDGEEEDVDEGGSDGAAGRVAERGVEVGRGEEQGVEVGRGKEQGVEVGRGKEQGVEVGRGEEQVAQTAHTMNSKRSRREMRRAGQEVETEEGQKLRTSRGDAKVGREETEPQEARLVSKTGRLGGHKGNEVRIAEGGKAKKGQKVEKVEREEGQTEERRKAERRKTEQKVTEGRKTEQKVTEGRGKATANSNSAKPNKWKKLKQQLKMGLELATLARLEAEGGEQVLGMDDDEDARRARDAFLKMYVPDPSLVAPIAAHPYKRSRATKTSQKRIDNAATRALQRTKTSARGSSTKMQQEQPDPEARPEEQEKMEKAESPNTKQKRQLVRERELMIEHPPRPQRRAFSQINREARSIRNPQHRLW
jgi:hypothetical protein